MQLKYVWRGRFDVRTHRLLGIVGLLIACSLTLAACGGVQTMRTVAVTRMVGGTPETVMTTTTPAASSQGSKTIKVDLTSSDIPTLDPSLSRDVYSNQVISELTVGLVRRDEVTGVFLPGMASSWDTSADGKTVTFNLRDDVPWVRWNGDQVAEVKDCNGNPRMVTAEDFKYALLRILDPATGSGSATLFAKVIKGGQAYFQGVGSAEDVAVSTPDSNTLVISFIKPAAFDIGIMSLAAAEPKWDVEGDDCTQGQGDRWTEPGSNQSYGPFALKAWIHDSTVTIIRNPFWPGTENIPIPKLDQVQFSLLDDQRALDSYEAGDLDVSPVPVSAVDRVKSDPKLSPELHSTLAPCSLFAGFNTKAPTVNDQRVRLALSEAVDRQSLSEDVTHGTEVPAHWFTAPGLIGAPKPEDYPDLGVRYDPTDARAQLQSYLEATGQTADQLDLTLATPSDPLRKSMGEGMQQMWKDVLGVNVKLTNQEFSVFLQSVLAPKSTYQIWALGWCEAYPDANSFLTDGVGYGGVTNPTNGGGLNWENNEYESLLDQATTEKDPGKRTDLYAQAEEILVRTDAVLIPLSWHSLVSLTKPYVDRTYSTIYQERFEKWNFEPH